MKTALLLCLMCICGIVHAQNTYILEGQIQDYRSTPLKRVKVMINGLNGVRPTYTNSEGRFLMEIPKGTKITNQTPFLVNGVQVALSDVQYSEIDNFVQINTDSDNKRAENPATRQVFMVRVRDKNKDPIRGTRVSVDGTYYYTNPEGEFRFLVTTEGIHQVDIVHKDSLQEKPQLMVQLPEEKSDIYDNLTLETADSLREKNIDDFIEKHIKLNRNMAKLLELSAKKAMSKEQEQFMKKLQGNLESSEKALQQALDTQRYLMNQVSIATNQIFTVQFEKDSLTRKKNSEIQNISDQKQQVEIEKAEEAEEFQRRLYALLLMVIGLSLCLYFLYRVFRKIKLQNHKISTQSEELQKTYQELQHKNYQLEENKLILTDRTGQLAQQKGEMENALEQLKSTQSQLIHSEKMAGLGTLTAGIAHEINNPVGFIYGGVESLEERIPELLHVSYRYEQLDLETDDKILREQLFQIEELKKELYYEELKHDITDSLKDIKLGADRTLEIVRGLRTFSRLDEGRYKTVDIHENIDSTLIILRSQYKNYVNITKNYAKIPFVECSPGTINQVVMNILGNAVQAIRTSQKGKGNIVISTNEMQNTNERMIYISIKDDGPGIPEEVKNQIFDPFFTTKDVGKGTGLGLSICMNIIEAHHGKLEVFSELGKGTEFQIQLPIKQKGVS